VQKDATHFDFILELQHPHIAKIVIRDVDVSLTTPSLSDGAKEDDGLRRIALTDRQWNRQQVRFDPGSPHLEVSGGGFERANLYTAELAKNCLNAGLWEVLQLVRIGADLIEQLVDQARFDLAPEHPDRTDNGGTQLLADQSRGEVLIIRGNGVLRMTSMSPHGPRRSSALSQAKASGPLPCSSDNA
jgi:hypothetical protein